MEYSVSHVRARLAGAKDRKARRQSATAVLYLPSGYVTAGMRVRWEDLKLFWVDAWGGGS